MRRIRIETPSKNEVSYLMQLGEDYKSFKKLNPEKTARIPSEIKQKAKEVLEGGATLQAISASTGVATPTITRWIDSLEKKSKKAVADKVSTVKASSVVPALVLEQYPTRAPAAVSGQENTVSNSNRDWVKIRIDGHEIEIDKKDFWDLLQSKSSL